MEIRAQVTHISSKLKVKYKLSLKHHFDIRLQRQLSTTRQMSMSMACMHTVCCLSFQMYKSKNVFLNNIWYWMWMNTTLTHTHTNIRKWFHAKQFKSFAFQPYYVSPRYTQASQQWIEPNPRNQSVLKKQKQWRIQLRHTIEFYYNSNQIYGSKLPKINK